MTRCVRLRAALHVALTDDFARFHYGEHFGAYVRGLRLEIQAARRVAADAGCGQPTTRSTSRPRGAGRPRARRVARTSARSGDSGDDGPGEPAAERAHPVAAVRP